MKASAGKDAVLPNYVRKLVDKAGEDAYKAARLANDGVAPDQRLAGRRLEVHLKQARKAAE